MVVVVVVVNPYNVLDIVSIREILNFQFQFELGNIYPSFNQHLAVTLVMTKTAANDLIKLICIEHLTAP